MKGATQRLLNSAAKAGYLKNTILCYFFNDACLIFESIIYYEIIFYASKLERIYEYL